MSETRQAERIASLETKVDHLQSELTEVNMKLDSLLALRYKGAGAFWAITLLSGSGLAGALTWLMSWFKG